MNFTFLPANNGDAIHINFTNHEGQIKNVLIDGGMPQTYLSYDKKGKIVDGTLKQLIRDLRTAKQKFDLVILTHVDQDHIGGLVRWIEKDPLAYEMIGEVWFNSGNTIKSYLKSTAAPPPEIILTSDLGRETSIGEGVTFEKYITDHDLWDKKVLLHEMEHTFQGLNFQFLSPGEQQLEGLLDKWQEEKPDSVQTTKRLDHFEPLAKLYQQDLAISDLQYKEDAAVHNGSSLAFILTFHGKKYLFLGDAFPSVLIKGLQYFGYSAKNPIKPEFVKISHHGSLANNSRLMLQMISARHFVISTDATRHNHPHKQFLARLIYCHPNCHIYFNYPDLIGRIFTAKDKEDFPTFKSLPIDQLPKV
ncbi:beta-lactamase superfamily II metal-dependent hydrolase [Mucilaginibacter frigoritolerans]|jgi:beta-lactamase superfamily II metal-dependent hydrolase|uniref:Beta-lactamase superfamily II metal-dependent hydrolase n=1 Tax=Mucilaginibacter frigoritolerans TaxID=652788 RepID=A0A562UGH9_9SPHI|nr:MBL fold metallo-hydrolase [Mucilaginibacter frigoritolerans]TWJ04946.1 beta-lactamase superfamily II metal-dependent hydrolase [Mucilaginibacter frigoritolerans]